MPNANPAIKEALGWKSAVKNSTSHLHNEYTDGGRLVPLAPVVCVRFSKQAAALDQSILIMDAEPRYYLWICDEL